MFFLEQMSRDLASHLTYLTRHCVKIHIMILEGNVAHASGFYCVPGQYGIGVSDAVFFLSSWRVGGGGRTAGGKG